MNDLTSPRNRRSGTRVTRSMGMRYFCAGSLHQGHTLNLSERGARIVVRHAMPPTFELSVGPVALRAETVWEERLGPSSRVVGIRFPRNQQVMEWAQAQL